MDIRLKVKEIATRKGFNQSTLARTANLDFKTVKRIFQNPNRDVNVSTVVKLAWALDVTLADLLEVSGEPHSRPTPTDESS
jgi:DNA-binding Xre family transcriptional regulator